MPRAGLNTAEVVGAGAELADEAGIGSVSLAAFAERLGVRPPALYKHVDGIGDLQHRIATLTMTELGDVLRDTRQGKSGVDAIGALFRAMQSYVAEHPGRYSATTGAEFQDGDDPLLAASARVIDPIRARLSGYGIRPNELDDAIRILRCTPPTKGATMATDTSTDRVAYNLELMKRGDDAFNSRDVAGMNAIHHPDMIAHVMGNAEPIHGRAAHAAIIEQMIHIFPDVHVNNDPYPIRFGTGDWITVVTRATGTFTGEMSLPDGNVIPPTGKAFDLDFATTARWEGDQLVEEYVFWDSALQAQQVGLA